MSKTTSAATSKSGGAAKADQAPTHSKDEVPRRRINMHMVQNVLLIWLDNNIDGNSADCRNTITQLQRIVNSINTFTDSDQCVDFLTDISTENICMIISGTICQNIVPLIHDVAQLHTIFIFCGNKTGHEKWAGNWSKIKGVFTKISSICKALEQVALQCEQNAIPISFMATGGDISKKKLDQLDPSFMYTQILKEILLTIKFEQQHITEFIDYYCEQFVENDHALRNIKNFKEKYYDETPILWYTSELFIYSTLNRALRLMEVDAIIKMGFFIGDLHRHIEELHLEQFADQKFNKSFTVYRGQGMSKTDFEQLTKTKDGLISFNNFLSTSENHDISLLFAESNQSNPDLVGILFVMTIDPSQSTTPFASIKRDSYFQVEDEVLFSMHTVFRIRDITPMGENHRLFQVNLILTSDNDKDLRILTDRIREETFSSDEGWQRLGAVLLKMSESHKALQVYEFLLNQATNESEKALIYHQFGWAKQNLGEYQEAIKYYEKSLEIYKKTLPPNHLNLATLHNNIGNVYQSMDEYSKALSSQEKALEIAQQSLPPNHPDLASSYNNIGLVYSNMGEYSKALSYYKKTLEIQQQSFPPNHPDLASSYNNIGNVYSNMGQYSNALSSHEKALGIRKQSLPPNHPDLAKSFMGHGVVYQRMGQQSKAIAFYEKALIIEEQSLPPNHPGLATSYNNIGALHCQMGEYAKALPIFEKALEIQQQSLPANHPDLAKSCNNIGVLYDSIGKYSKALSSHEKALEIRKQSLPPNHPHLASSYNGIGAVYYGMGEYSKALSYYKKALEIQQQSLPPNHPDLAYPYNNIGLVYDHMGENSKALSSHEKALEIKQQSLPPNHLDFGMSYNNIGNVYYKMGQYSKALSYYEKALEIQQQSLPPNHPDLAASYGNIGSVYENMGNYSKARSFYERAVDIAQRSLPSNHPNLQKWRRNIDRVKTKLLFVLCFFGKEK